MSGINSVYWDSCVFLDWLQNTPREPFAIEGLKEQIEQFKNGKLIIATSVITFTEVLRIGIEKSQYEEFIRLFARRYVQPLQITLPIAKLAGELREFYIQNNVPPKESKKTLSSPDSLHVAACIANGISVFYTYDGINTQKNKDKSLPLLLLKGRLIADKYNLHITTPPPGTQGELNI